MSESRICSVTSQPFTISDREKEAYEYFDLPLPEICSEERYRRRLAFTNERRFYWRNCDITGQRLYSAFPKSTPFPVVTPDIWLDDSWDNLSHGRDYDFSKSFFEQLFELWRVVPRPASMLRYVKSSFATHNSHYVKNCFMVTRAAQVEHSYYSVGIRDSVDCCDCLGVSKCEVCYECVDCHDCKNLRWSEHCYECSDSSFLFCCTNCSNCLFCANLEGKEYCILNKQVSKEEYERTLQNWNFTYRRIVEEGKETFHEFIADQPLPHIFSDQPAGCSGNYLYGCESIYESFQCDSCVDLLHCNSLVRAQNCLDGHSFGEGLENAAQFVSVGLNAEDIINCVECSNNVSNLTYCFYCENSSHLFACVGLRNRQYCILNRQYSRTQYYELLGAIRDQLKSSGQWGMFFPVAFSSYAYNQSAAQDYMALSETQAALMSFIWEDEAEFIRPSEFVAEEDAAAASELFDEVPASLEEISLEQMGESVFLCEITGRPFQFSVDEMELHRRLGVALPARSFEQRHRERLARLGPAIVKQRRSDESKNELRSAFPKEWKQPVYGFAEWQRAVKRNSQLNTDATA